METIDPAFKKILNMFGSNAITEIKEIIDLSTSTYNRSIISSLKTKIKIEQKNIFSNFDLDVIPEILIDDQMFQIKIKGNDTQDFQKLHQF